MRRWSTVCSFLSQVHRQFKQLIKNVDFEFSNSEYDQLDEQLADTVPHHFKYEYPPSHETTKSEIDETQVFLCTSLRMQYYYDQPGPIQQQDTADVPEHALDIYFDKFVDQALIYGPWADHQRSLIQGFFFPRTFENPTVIRNQTGIGLRQPEFFALRLVFQHETNWNFPYIRSPRTKEEVIMRKGKQERLSIVLQPQSYILWNTAMGAVEHGAHDFKINGTEFVQTNIHFHLLGAKLITTNTGASFGEASLLKVLISCSITDDTDLSLDTLYP